MNHPALAAHVKEITNTVATLGTQVVTFYFETTDNMILAAGSVKTKTNGDGTAPATLALSTTFSKEFVDGTGLWFATYAATRDFLGSSTTVESTAATSPTQSAVNAFNLFRKLESTPGNKITVVPDTTPPGCQPRQLKLTTTTSLLGVSLAALTCKALQVLQILDGVCLGVSFALGGGSSTIVDVIQDVQLAGLKAANQVVLEQLASRVVVTAPPEYI